MYKLLPILLFTYGLALTTEDIYDNSWAVIIGIDKYKYSDQLNYAVKDAEAVKDMLITKFQFPEENIRYLVNEQATLSEIKLALDYISTSAGENDRIVVFYSGHGETVGAEGSEKGYIIPYEGIQKKAYATGLAMDEILTISQLSKSKHMLFLMDACYSGLMTEKMKGLAQPKEQGYLSKVANEKARQIITAGGSNEQVIERDEWRHSAFTKNLLAGLDGWDADVNGDGYITADELGSYLAQTVTEDSDNLQTPRKGRFKNSGSGEFIFVKALSQIIPGMKTLGPRIAVIDFEGIGVSLEEARVLTQRLTTEIISLDVYQIFERSKINRILEEQKFQYSGCVDVACAVDIGKLVGVQHMIIGTVSKIGQTYSVDSRLIDVASGESLISAKYSTQNSIDDLLTDGMRSVSYKLCNMEIPKPKPPTFFERINNHKGKIILTWLILWFGWGLLPA